MRPAVALLLAASAFIAGCATSVDNPLDPRIPDDWTCPTYDPVRVQVLLENPPPGFQEVTFLTYSGYRAMLSCVGPPPEVSLPANSSAGASGFVVAQEYEEVRLRFNDRVIRAAVPVPLTENGTLRIGLPERVEKSGPLGLEEKRVQGFEAAWNRRVLDVEAVERHDDPRALDEHHAAWEGQRLRRGTWTDAFVVNSTWNRGVYVEALLTGESALVDNREAARGARLALRLVDPRGFTTDTREVTDPFGHEVIAHHLPEAGEWRVEAEARAPDSGARLAYQVLVRFEH